MSAPNKGGLRILMVDDMADDRMLVKRALDASGVGVAFVGVEDGQEAIHYLRAEGAYADREQCPVPNVILCDLKMPRVDGFEFLQWVKDHAECAVIPVIIFSSSTIEADVVKAYRLRANAFMSKPSDFNTIVELIRATYRFWSMCERPLVPLRC